MDQRPNPDDVIDQVLAEEQTKKARSRVRRVLLLGLAAQPAVTAAFEQVSTDHRPIRTLHASTLQDARNLAARGHIDLLVLASSAADGNPLSLLAELRGTTRKLSAVKAVVATDRPTMDGAVAALRMGAVDYLPLPMVAHELRHRLERALARRTREQQQEARVRRLRRLCRKLDDARQEVSEQVDELCNELLDAYHELAKQSRPEVKNKQAQNGDLMHKTTRGVTEFFAMEQAAPPAASAEASTLGVTLTGELDLEQTVRRVLEHVVERCGATNAAMFLPASMDEWTLGGYVNLSCGADAADLLLEHLADVLAPKVAERDSLLRVTSDATMERWIGDDAVYLTDSDLMVVPCRCEDETLAVVAVFRDRDEPYDDAAVETMHEIGRTLGEHLARIIRVHHRAELLWGDEDEVWC